MVREGVGGGGESERVGGEGCACVHLTHKQVCSSNCQHFESIAKVSCV